jgi:hypothetical protein
VVFRSGDRTSVAGGWQPLLAYDTVIANLEPGLDRMPPPETPEWLLHYFPHGLTTAEVALLLADGPDPVADIPAAAAALTALVEEGKATRIPLGTDALWRNVNAVGV